MLVNLSNFISIRLKIESTLTVKIPDKAACGMRTVNAFDLLVFG